MQEVIHLDDRGGGLATIFYQGERWRRVPGDGPDSQAEWQADEERADRKLRRIFEHTYRHQEMATPIKRKPRLRHPRLPDLIGHTVDVEELIEKANVVEANNILTIARRALAAASWDILEAGRALNWLKPMFPKGTWLARLKMEADRTGYKVRTLQDYMKAAWEADAKNAEVRAFAKPTDAKAVAIEKASEAAEQKVKQAITAGDLVGPTGPKAKISRKSPPLKDGTFNLPLRLTGKEKEASKRALASEEWPELQADMTASWRRRLDNGGFLTSGSASREESSQSSAEHSASGSGE